MSDEFEFVKNDIAMTNWSELGFVGDPDEPSDEEIAAIQEQLQAALEESVERVLTEEAS